MTPEVRTMNVADTLVEAMQARGTCACVGIDPVLDRLPDRTSGYAVAHVESFVMRVLDAVAAVVPAVKFQSACFERFGAEGMAVLERTMAHAREAGLVVVLDAKRGDIGISAEHYAVAAFETTCAHWLTVSPWLGAETIEPMLSRGGAFVLVRTSNPGADDLQTLRLEDGRSLADAAADMVHTLGRSTLGIHGRSCAGAVVGATRPEAAEALRSRMPDAILLMPGIGAQGGSVDACRALCGDDGCGALLPASRSVLYAFESSDGNWVEAVREAAASMADQAGVMAGLR